VDERIVQLAVLAGALLLLHELRGVVERDAQHSVKHRQRLEALDRLVDLVCTEVRQMAAHVDVDLVVEVGRDLARRGHDSLRRVGERDDQTVVLSSRDAILSRYGK
jgi:hypothetical protein